MFSQEHHHNVMQMTVTESDDPLSATSAHEILAKLITYDADSVPVEGEREEEGCNSQPLEEGGSRLDYRHGAAAVLHALATVRQGVHFRSTDSRFLTEVNYEVVTAYEAYKALMLKAKETKVNGRSARIVKIVDDLEDVRTIL